MTAILTHRGLDPARENWFLESSKEAFAHQLQRGYGLEFDIRQCADGGLVVLHDGTLSRITGGADTRTILECSTEEITSRHFDNGSIGTLSDILTLIRTYGSPHTYHALHVKSALQQESVLIPLLQALEVSELANIFLFDVTIETARFIHTHAPTLPLAPSVAHPHDIARYNNAVGGTLISVEEALTNRNLFDWVWLDEWDRRDEQGGKKALYTEDVFQQFRQANMKIGLVTPELHGTSPGLLGGEAHEDAREQSNLMARITEILALQPDVLCTDYPDAVSALIGN